MGLHVRLDERADRLHAQAVLAGVGKACLDEVCAHAAAARALRHEGVDEGDPLRAASVDEFGLARLGVGDEARETIAGEDILDEMGAFSIIASDSQAMGRVGEVLIRTWQTADKMKRQRGRLSDEEGSNDNFRVRRYIAKYTINPAIAHGISGHIGSIEVGKRADLCLWSPAFFGVKPEMTLVGGTIACAQMGDPNASIPTPQPVYSRPMFGAFGGSQKASSVHFVSGAAETSHLGLEKETLAVENVRSGIGKSAMILNDYCPQIEVHPETYEVRADGELLTCEPAEVLPMAQRYFMF